MHETSSQQRLAADADLAVRRAEVPIGPAGTGTHLMVRYDDVIGVLRDDGRYRPEHDPAVPPEASAQWAADAAEHMRRRVGVFAPARVEAVTPALAASAADLIGAVAVDGTVDRTPDGTFDVVTAVLEPLAVTAIGELLGILVSDRERVFAAVDAMAAEATHHGGQAALAAWLDEELLRRAGLDVEPDDGLAILQAIDGPTGRGVQPVELVAYTYLICRSGMGPLRRLLANVVRRLAADPSALDALHEHRNEGAGFVELVLRDDPPIQYLIRSALDDVLIGDYRIGADERLVMSLRSANADRAAVGGPLKHVSFGRGERYCPAATLGRRTASLLAEALAALVGRIELVDPAALAALEAPSVWTPVVVPTRFVRRPG